jgi:hypothetical protein
MSNCDLVAARSLIALAASRLALRAPALRAATALTRPNGSAQRLHSDRHAMPTAMTVGPNKVVDYAKREHLRKPSLLMRAHVSLFAAPPRKVSAAKMLRKPKEFAQHFKRHFLKRHLRVRVLPPQPGSWVSVGYVRFPKIRATFARVSETSRSL